ncbi:hypothetical protein B0A55_08981, partial [Friedmanniomyces simplex]
DITPQVLYDFVHHIKIVFPNHIIIQIGQKEQGDIACTGCNSSTIACYSQYTDRSREIGALAVAGGGRSQPTQLVSDTEKSASHHELGQVGGQSFETSKIESPWSQQEAQMDAARKGVQFA